MRAEPLGLYHESAVRILQLRGQILDLLRDLSVLEGEEQELSLSCALAATHEVFNVLQISGTRLCQSKIRVGRGLHNDTN